MSISDKSLPNTQETLLKYLKLANITEFWLKNGSNQFLKVYIENNQLSYRFTLLTAANDGKKYRSISLQKHTDCYQYLRQLVAKKGEGAFFGCSDGSAILPLNDYQIVSSDIVTEIDDLDKNTQLDRYKEFEELSGLNLTIVSSGGKSYHGHLFTTTHLPIDTIIYLRILLCIAMDGDPALFSPHQPFRIPTFYRAKKGNYQSVLQFGHQYTFDELITGFKKVFAAKGLMFPHIISEPFKRQIRSTLNLDKETKARKAAPITKEEKWKRLKALLLKGNDAFEREKAQRETKRKNVQKVYDTFKQKSGFGKSNNNTNNNESLKYILDILAFIPHRTKGEGSYSMYRAIFTGIKNTLGFDIALELANQWCPTGEDWEKILSSSTGKYTIKSLIHYAKIFGYKPPKNDDESFDLEAWLKFKEAELREIQRQYRALTRTPNVVVNKRFCEYSDLKDLPDDFSGIIVLKGAKGTGKSRIIGYLVDYDGIKMAGPDTLIYRLKQWDFNFISLTPRRALCEESSERWGFTFINKGTNPKEKYRYANDVNDISLCVDSLQYLCNRLEESEEKICLILDEIESFCGHLLTSSTLKAKRHLILKYFERLIEIIYRNGGIILVSDADLSDFSLDYIQDISRKVNNNIFPEFIYINEYKPQRLVEIFHSEKQWYEEVAQDLSDDKKPLIACDGRVFSNATGLCITSSDEELDSVITNQKDFIKFNNPDKTAVVINSDTIKDSTTAARDFVKNPNKEIEENKPDTLIYTGSMGMGVSIDVKDYFSGVFGKYSGNITPEDVRQSLWRLRDTSANINLYVPEKGCKLNYRWAFTREECVNQLINEKSESFDTSEFIRYFYDCQDNLDYIKAIGKTFNPDGTIKCPHLKAIGQIYAMNNYGQKYYRELILEQLAEEGCILACRLPDSELKGHTKTVISTKKKELRLDEIESVSDAPNIPFNKAQEMAKSETLTKEQEAMVQKAFITHELPTIDVNFLNCHNLLWNYRRVFDRLKLRFMMENLEIAKFYGRKAWADFIAKIEPDKDSIYSDFGIPLCSDVKTFAGRAKLLKTLGIPDLIRIPHSSTINGDNPQIKKFRDKCLRNKNKIKDIFGVHISKRGKTETWLKRLLEFIGYKIEISSEGDTTSWCIIPINCKADEKLFEDYSEYYVKYSQVVEECPPEKLEKRLRELGLPTFDEAINNLHPLSDFATNIYDSLFKKFEIDLLKFDPKHPQRSCSIFLENQPDATSKTSKNFSDVSNRCNDGTAMDRFEKKVPYYSINEEEPIFAGDILQDEDDFYFYDEGGVDLPDGFFDDSEEDHFWQDEDGCAECGEDSQIDEVEVEQGEIETPTLEPIVKLDEPIEIVNDNQSSSDDLWINDDLSQDSNQNQNTSDLGTNQTEIDKVHQDTSMVNEDNNMNVDSNGTLTEMPLESSESDFKMGDEVWYCHPQNGWVKGIFGTVDEEKGWYWVWDALTYKELPCSKHQVEKWASPPT